MNKNGGDVPRPVLRLEDVEGIGAVIDQYGTSVSPRRQLKQVSVPPTPSTCDHTPVSRDTPSRGFFSRNMGNNEKGEQVQDDIDPVPEGWTGREVNGAGLNARSGRSPEKEAWPSGTTCCDRRATPPGEENIGWRPRHDKEGYTFNSDQQDWLPDNRPFHVNAPSEDCSMRQVSCRLSQSNHIGSKCQPQLCPREY
ncbi:unnamed protein product, partial [Discosporangium mesarthrocarpum]